MTRYNIDKIFVTFGNEKSSTTRAILFPIHRLPVISGMVFIPILPRRKK